jgi:nitrate reductase beta subunit
MGMVMNLDKCIGCHTCSVTCKQAWTNRSGVEYVWFNNVETRPGQGYPRRYQDQERWKGGWVRNRRGRLSLKAGGRFKKLLTIFANPVLPNIRDYYEPWTYDYEKLTDAPLGDDFPVAQPKSLLSGEPMAIEWSANWDDDLGGAPEHGPRDPIVERLRRASEDAVRFSYEQAFMFFLPRICEHCLNPSCVASCPSGAMYKRAEDGIVLVDQDQCRGLADVRDRLPVQEGVLQPPHRQGGEVHVVLPAHRGRPAHRLFRDVRGAAALPRAVPLRRRPRHRRRLGGGRA